MELTFPLRKRKIEEEEEEEQPFKQLRVEGPDCFQRLKSSFPHVYESIGGTERQLPSLEDINTYLLRFNLPPVGDISEGCGVLLSASQRLQQIVENGLMNEPIVLSRQEYNYFHSLPNEVLSLIFQYVIADLRYKSQLEPYRLVSKRVNEITRDVFLREQERFIKSLQGASVSGMDFCPTISNYNSCFSNSLTSLSKQESKVKTFYFSLADSAAVGDYKELVKININSDFYDLESLYREYRRSINPKYFGTPILSTVTGVFYIRDWDSVAWACNCLNFAYSMTRIDSVFLYRKYQKELFTFRDILERMFYFYSGALLPQDVENIKSQVINLNKRSQSDFLYESLYKFAVSDLLSGQSILKTVFGASFGGSLVLVSRRKEKTSKEAWIRDAPPLLQEQLTSFFQLSTEDQLFVLAFATNFADLFKPKEFLLKYQQDIRGGRVRRKSLLYKKGILNHNQTFIIDRVRSILLDNYPFNIWTNDEYATFKFL